MRSLDALDAATGGERRAPAETASVFGEPSVDVPLDRNPDPSSPVTNVPVLSLLAELPAGRQANASALEVELISSRRPRVVWSDQRGRTSWCFGLAAPRRSARTGIRGGSSGPERSPMPRDPGQVVRAARDEVDTAIEARRIRSDTVPGNRVRPTARGVDAQAAVRDRRTSHAALSASGCSRRWRRGPIWSGRRYRRQS